MKLKVLNIQDVAEAQLCCGCGTCASVSPDEIEMIDVLDHGRRPRFKGGKPPVDPRSDQAMKVCPGIHLEHQFDRNDLKLVKELAAGWGPVLEIWEGFAADDEIRFAGSSGGAASARALFAMEQAGFAGTLHIAARPDVPYLNHTVLSTSREEILANTGSRYAPASPCDSLHLIEQAASPCVLIGKPCDIAGAQQARAIRPKLDKNLGLTIGIFCAGTPSTKGTLLMLKQMGFDDPSAVQAVRYRGNGWPGMAVGKGEVAGAPKVSQLTYKDSWGGILQKHRQWRCYICPDHTGEFADIAVGDPWYHDAVPDDPKEPGRSLVVVRTERGRQVLQKAMAAGYLKLERKEAWTLPASQDYLIKTRGNVWARLKTLRLMGAPTPKYVNIPMARFWFSALGWKEKLQSFVGTAKRVFRKRLKDRIKLEPYKPAPSQGSALVADVKD
jgi:coenzyme F420 hydrogenase subunit beta